MEDRKVTAAELKRALATDFEQYVERIASAMNSAQTGRIIADSEEPVRDASAEFRQSAYQRAIDLLHDKLVQGDFSPSAGPAGSEVEA